MSLRSTRKKSFSIQRECRWDAGASMPCTVYRVRMMKAGATCAEELVRVAPGWLHVAEEPAGEGRLASQSPGESYEAMLAKREALFASIGDMLAG